MFASDEGFPVLVLSAGVPAGQLQPADARTPNLAATAILRVSDATHSRLPMYFERRLDAPLDVARWTEARGDRTAFVAMTDMLPLLPGEYDWRIVFRDERSGKMGGIGGRVLLKDFRGPSTSSSLLLTRQLARLEATAAVAAGTGRQPLDAGDVRFVPQPSMVFSKGETVHLLYTVYNATPEDLDAVKQGMQLALLRNGQAGWRRRGRGRAGRGRQARRRFSLPAPSARPRWSRARTPSSACCRTSRRARPSRSSSASC